MAPGANFLLVINAAPKWEAFDDFKLSRKTKKLHNFRSEAISEKSLLHSRNPEKLV